MKFDLDDYNKSLKLLHEKIDNSFIDFQIIKYNDQK